jgi:hypothetical protein
MNKLTKGDKNLYGFEQISSPDVDVHHRQD